MKTGDLVTWKVDVKNGQKLDYGVVVGIARYTLRNTNLLWVKFLTGSQSNKKKTLCNKKHLILVEDIK